MKVIIYNDASGQMRRIFPNPEFLKKHTVDEVAKKDVPVGLPYKIIEDVDMPENWQDRAAWEVDTLDLTDGVGAEWDTIDEGAQ